MNVQRFKLARLVFCVFDLVFFLMTLGTLTICVFSLVIYEYKRDIFTNEDMHFFAVYLITVTSFAFAASCIGFYGALRVKPYFICVFIGTILSCIIMQLCSIGWKMLSINQQVANNLVMKSFQKTFLGTNNKINESFAIFYMLKDLEYDMSCCGLNSSADYSNYPHRNPCKSIHVQKGCAATFADQLNRFLLFMSLMSFVLVLNEIVVVCQAFYILLRVPAYEAYKLSPPSKINYSK
jgi:hypothetical protein